jgi:hypothetical protein
MKKGDFVLVYMFDSKYTHQRYFPPDGSFGDEINKVYEENKTTCDDFHNKYFVLEKYHWGIIQCLPPQNKALLTIAFSMASLINILHL